MKLNWLLWLIVAIILYRQIVPLASLVKNFPLNDFSVYIDGTKAALSGENPYKQKYFDRFNYPPPAAVFFIPLAALPVELSEWLFTGLSILSVWLAVNWTLKSLRWIPRLPRRYVGVARDDAIKWLIFALCLKMFPVKLTLALGQINLIILALIIGSYYFCKVRLPRPTSPRLRGARNDGKVGEALSGILFGLATVIKLTPAPILIYFLLKKEWKVVGWWLSTVAVLTISGIMIFGWDLTKYYFVSVVPGLMSEVTRETVNASYMNQSVTALFARMGIFGSVNAIIRLVMSGGLLLFILMKWSAIAKIAKISENREQFIFFWSLVVISILFLPVFVWQHHYVFLLPAWIILLNNAVKSRRLFDWLAVGISYGLLNFYFHDANWLSGKNPLIISHFLVTGVITLLLVIRSLRGVPMAIGTTWQSRRDCRASPV